MYQPSDGYEREILDRAMRSLNPAEQDRLQQALDHAFRAEQALAKVATELMVAEEIGEASVAIWWDVWQVPINPVPRPVLDKPIDLGQEIFDLGVSINRANAAALAGKKVV